MIRFKKNKSFKVKIPKSLKFALVFLLNFTGTCYNEVSASPNENLSSSLNFIADSNVSDFISNEHLAPKYFDLKIEEYANMEYINEKRSGFDSKMHFPNPFHNMKSVNNQGNTLINKRVDSLNQKKYDPKIVLTDVKSASIKKNNIIIDSIGKHIFFPVKNGTNLRNFDPQFLEVPNITISPKAPYNFTNGKVRVNILRENEILDSYWISAAVANNPVLDGYYADPEILYSNKTKKYYIYPTSDGFTGWSGTYFKTFSSKNLIDWKDEGVILDLPKDVTWGKKNAWAPTIAEKKVNGEFKYFYYFTASQKIGVAVAQDPVGPFKDSGKALIDKSIKGIKSGQEIDPDVFTDPTSGKNYLYWGNGYLAVALLNDDMVSIDTSSVKIITPDKTFREGAEVFYRKGRYYFLWSENDTRSPDYGVRYGYSDSPIGKIVIPPNNLILSKRPEEGIYGTGHNSIINKAGTDKWFIVYHRFSLPKGITMGRAAGYNREVCIDQLNFNEDGTIHQVKPTVHGLSGKN
ncbi:hypothetical protein ASU31_00480 [Pedobacter ginsenosidimutans]|uniref:Beta-xylosidase n=1 Tax=Pedobacter ginsenosidimutans TaxID=687842 RepID=A0A0T5VVB0_9SPHI|nr:family 43 glycosylhydrolase [Pedobacter ginsenosidimutans]KRT17809.1 hypothetical protein ASU31_00480 [Pedobacter ginsenosidimutans]